MGSKPEWTPRPEPALEQRWVYRRSDSDEIAEVEVLRVGIRRPARVLVRFVAYDYEGLQDWVPPARLKALWADVAEYQA
jgi:hypothetical protein